MNKTQNEQILEVLKSGGSITALEAQNRFGIMRLASRINDLKSSGHTIISRMVSVQNRQGHAVKVARYSLA